MRTLAIGDIHGMSTNLDALLNAIQLKPSDHLIFLGDYVDRGPDSRGVLDRLMHLKKHFQITCLRGNHELMMSRARTSRDEYKMWYSVGGQQALMSYGLLPNIKNVPDEHWQFLETGLVNCLETDRFIFVHANLSPAKHPDEEGEGMLFWEFLTGSVNHVSGKLIICGHTSQKTGLPLDLGNTICIDTYACGGGWLTCLDLNTLHYWQTDVLGRVREGDLPKREHPAQTRDRSMNSRSSESSKL